ncbi:MAG: 23S rRNA (adenine(2503)-C(2))-methyltransferase RlmN [Rhodospirillales bacterium]|nr:23S rRNA (adenine(2503)-C(2))-methyltransferase RlmN [Rhodospirillales bacterium]
MTDTKKNLVGLSRDELKAEMVIAGEKPFRAKQVWHWVYHQGETDFAKMTTLSKDAREKLAQNYVVARPQVAENLLSEDKSRKWLLRLDDGNEVEMVFIPEDDRGAVCVSSQVGCTLTCKFCNTGTQRLVRNLSCEEIVGQFMIARDTYGEWPTPTGERLLSNIVLMGMGEPLYNAEEVVKAMKIVMDGEGIALSKRRITLSTAGVVPEIIRCGEELGVNLAVSLHAANDALRNQIMPINKKYPLDQLMDACRNYPGANNARRITFEYVMLKDINDSLDDAKELVKLIEGLPCKFNLIPFNGWPGVAYECSSGNAMHRFSNYLNDAGYSAPIRVSRGRDIMAACGQLKSESERKRKAS